MLPVSIRASRAGGDVRDLYRGAGGHRFNPRLPRGRRRSRGPCSPQRSRCFNPRLPRGRRPDRDAGAAAGRHVSIRASRAGGDPGYAGTHPPDFCFNPRLPRGRRREPGIEGNAYSLFQSAPPAREATRRDCRNGRVGCFNPRLPRGRRLRLPSTISRRSTCFNPRLPRGRRQRLCGMSMEDYLFQSAPPAREATTARWRDPSVSGSFNPRLPRGRRRTATGRCTSAPVSIRASRAGGDEDTERTEKEI